MTDEFLGAKIVLSPTQAVKIPAPFDKMGE